MSMQFYADIGVVIATKWSHSLFHLQPYFSQAQSPAVGVSMQPRYVLLTELENEPIFLGTGSYGYIEIQ